MPWEETDRMLRNEEKITGVKFPVRDRECICIGMPEWTHICYACANGNGCWFGPCICPMNGQEVCDGTLSRNCRYTECMRCVRIFDAD
jgi:hypothetical protein